MRDTNTYADPADYANTHGDGKSDRYSNGNTYNYSHTYLYSQNNTAASSHAACTSDSVANSTEKPRLLY